MSYYAVIMAGGVGSRFWPVSRTEMPKQFLDILGVGKSLLQMTYERFASFLPEENIYIVTNEGYRELIREQLPHISEHQVLGEPMARNTAPCIAYACSKIKHKDPNGIVVVAPSDHLILNPEAFKTQVEKALTFASEGDRMVTLGIKPTRPDTGYGYIQYVGDEVQPDIHKVKTFTEKPNDELAVQFLESGDFLWNAGIFIWSLQAIGTAFDEHLPDIAELFAEGQETYFTDNEAAFIARIYPACQSISIDYGIIEKAENVYVLPSEFGWSDLGTWKSLYEVSNKNEAQNVILGNEIEAFDSERNLVYASSEKVVILEGVNDLFVLDTPDALLVCHMDREQEVKRIVNDIKQRYKGKYI